MSITEKSRARYGIKAGPFQLSKVFKNGKINKGCLGKNKHLSEMKKIILFMVVSLIFMFLGYFLRTITTENQKTYLHEEVKQGFSDKNIYPAYSLPKSFFDESFADLPENVIPEGTGILGMTVNHHLLGTRLISRLFKNISYLKPKTVVLLSPNHFNAGHAPIISSEYHWDTPYGILKNDAELTEELVKLDLIYIDESPFPVEHGISGLTAHIKYIFPGSRIIPIIFRNNVKEEKIKLLADHLAKFDHNDVLVVASLDFSHDSTSQIADIRDEISIEVIKSFDLQRTDDVEVDSRPALRVLMHYATAKNASGFELLDNTNSAKLLNDFVITDATSYINGYFYK